MAESFCIYIYVVVKLYLFVFKKCDSNQDTFGLKCLYICFPGLPVIDRIIKQENIFNDPTMQLNILNALYEPYIESHVHVLYIHVFIARIAYIYITKCFCMPCKYIVLRSCLHTIYTYIYIADRCVDIYACIYGHTNSKMFSWWMEIH